jgi:hypothetical protein
VTASTEAGQSAWEQYRAGERNAEAIARTYQAKQSLENWRAGERTVNAGEKSPMPASTPTSNTQKPKPLWQRAGEWISSPIGYGTLIGGVIGGIIGGVTFGLAGLIGGAAVGATAGAIWGSAQEGYLHTTRLLLSNPWSDRRPADFPHNPAKATDWLLKTMQSNAQGPVAQTLRQVHDEMGLTGRLVTLPNWIGLVQGEGPWDFKPDQQKWFQDKDLTKPMDLAGVQVRRDAFSNIHYGYVGRSLGYSRWLLELGGGAAQIQAGRSNLAYWRTWFDDPVDNAAIRVGMDLYDGYTAQGKPLDENALREALQKHPDLLCTPECKTTP